MTLQDALTHGGLLGFATIMGTGVALGLVFTGALIVGVEGGLQLRRRRWEQTR